MCYSSTKADASQAKGTQRAELKNDLKKNRECGDEGKGMQEYQLLFIASLEAESGGG